MVGKSTKPRRSATRPKAGDPGVLGSLPATRTARIGGERGDPAEAASSSAPAKRATTAKAKAPPAKRKAAARAKAKPAAKPKPKQTPKPAATAKPRAAPAKPRAVPAPSAGPRPVRSASPTLELPGERPAPPPPPTSGGPPSGTELVTTAIQAAGELAQIGLKVSGQLAKRALDRLPKP